MSKEYLRNVLLITTQYVLDNRDNIMQGVNVYDVASAIMTRTNCTHDDAMNMLRTFVRADYLTTFQEDACDTIFLDVTKKLCDSIREYNASKNVASLANAMQRAENDHDLERQQRLAREEILASTM